MSLICKYGLLYEAGPYLLFKYGLIHMENNTMRQFNLPKI